MCLVGMSRELACCPNPSQSFAVLIFCFLIHMLSIDKDPIFNLLSSCKADFELFEYRAAFRPHWPNILTILNTSSRLFGSSKISYIILSLKPCSKPRVG